MHHIHIICNHIRRKSTPNTLDHLTNKCWFLTNAGILCTSIKTALAHRLAFGQWFIMQRIMVSVIMGDALNLKHKNLFFIL